MVSGVSSDREGYALSGRALGVDQLLTLSNAEVIPAGGGQVILNWNTTVDVADVEKVGLAIT